MQNMNIPSNQNTGCLVLSESNGEAFSQWCHEYGHLTVPDTSQASQSDDVATNIGTDSRAGESTASPKLSPRLASIKKYPESSSKGLALGLTMVVIGLAFIPLSAGTSLVMLIPGVAAYITTIVGIGVGSGFCGAGFGVLVLDFLARLNRRPPPVQIDCRKPENDVGNNQDDQEHGSSRSVSPEQTPITVHPSPPPRYASTSDYFSDESDEEGASDNESQISFTTGNLVDGDKHLFFYTKVAARRAY